MNPPEFHISSYPSIYQIGHRAIRTIFDSPVTVEEKIDGSQFSFGLVDGKFVCRSKGREIVPDAPEKLFRLGVMNAQALPLKEGWIYRCEYLATPSHNSLSYLRTPKSNVMLFDVQTGPETYLEYIDKETEAARIGIECVPLLHFGMVTSLDQFTAFLNLNSILGGCKIEGVVVKNYAQFGPDKKIMIGKFVSEAFKEIHGVKWKEKNPTQTDVVTMLTEAYRTEARWNKAIQHLRDDGKILDAPQDIGTLIREIPEDVLRDSEGAIKDALFAHFWPHIKRGLTNGFPEFYKSKLATLSLPSNES